MVGYTDLVLLYMVRGDSVHRPCVVGGYMVRGDAVYIPCVLWEGTWLEVMLFTYPAYCGRVHG